ncbi:MAG TPA: Xaa-Pro peptidase family protein, partial [Flavobacteriaceae bacterium]|nr:Xaa-Pro peptidase family protein [Flavobacteriaceae bacterium]
MRGFCYFTPEEHATRLNNVRSKMEEYNFDACLITSPENIYYLIGLDHQGYFGPHILIVPRQDGMIIVARAHEVTTCERQAGNAIFKGYSDTQEAGKFVSEILKKMNLGNANIGIQKASLCFPPTISDSLKDNLPEVKWGDANGLVESFRMIKSSREIQYIKKSANISDKMMQKAIDTAGEGVSEKEIAACIHEVMIREGGEPPGFGPFVRSAERLPYEHEIWSDRILQKGDQVILEMAASFKRYHSPMGRLIYVDKAPDGTVEVEKICI